MTQERKREVLKLLPGEAAELIRRSNRRPLELTVPAHSIFVTDKNHWALEEMAKMRGVTHD